MSSAGGGKEGGEDESRVQEGHESMDFWEMRVITGFRAEPSQEVLPAIHPTLQEKKQNESDSAICPKSHNSGVGGLRPEPHQSDFRTPALTS